MKIAFRNQNDWGITWGINDEKIIWDLLAKMLEEKKEKKEKKRLCLEDLFLLEEC